MKVSTAVVICAIASIWIGIIPGVILFFLGFGWFVRNKDGKKIF